MSSFFDGSNALLALMTAFEDEGAEGSFKLLHEVWTGLTPNEQEISLVLAIGVGLTIARIGGYSREALQAIIRSAAAEQARKAQHDE